MDVVVTVPKNFRYGDKRGLAAWISEGDAAGDDWSGADWVYSTLGARPKIEIGERVYIVCEGRLRGYAPLTDLEMGEMRGGRGAVYLVREGGAVALTLPAGVTGFRGWRYRWWKYEQEVPFPDWKASK